MKAKLGFLSKEGTVKLFRKVPEGIELLVDLAGGGSATIVLSDAEAAGIVEVVQAAGATPPAPKVA